jgi:hypothetical protein
VRVVLAESIMWNGRLLILPLAGTYPRAAAYHPSIRGSRAMDEPIAVLVVDDDTSIQQIVEETLSDDGFVSKNLLHRARRQ